MQQPRKIFICYRRKTDAPAAGWLHTLLEGEFGRDTVFRDGPSIPLGADIHDEIATNLRDVAVIVPVVGPEWATVTGDGGLRLAAADDPVVAEIIHGLACARTMVLPVVVNDASWPTPAEWKALPDRLRPMAALKHTQLGNDTFEHDLAPLINEIRQWLGRVGAVVAKPEANTWVRISSDGPPHPKQAQERSAIVLSSHREATAVEVGHNIRLLRVPTTATSADAAVGRDNRERITVERCRAGTTLAIDESARWEPIVDDEFESLAPPAWISGHLQLLSAVRFESDADRSLQLWRVVANEDFAVGDVGFEVAPDIDAHFDLLVLAGSTQKHPPCLLVTPTSATRTARTDWSTVR